MTLTTRQRRIGSLAAAAAISIASFALLFAATSALINEFLRHGEFLVSSRIVRISPIFFCAYASSIPVMAAGIVYRRAAQRKIKAQQNRPQRRRRIDPALSILR
jgi:divalent metal cation (Fe/Co/Zn/Cd) transporter